MPDPKTEKTTKKQLRIVSKPPAIGADGNSLTLTNDNFGDRRDGFLQIKVSDFGIGIDKKDLPYVFDRFYQADKSRSENQGYGLGLAIAKEVVEAHLGVISVKSELNKGTTFTVRFPLV